MNKLSFGQINSGMIMVQALAIMAGVMALLRVRGRGDEQ